MVERALITGVTGQDGHYLAHYLRSQGWRVYGGHRRSTKGEIPGMAEPVPLEMTEYESIARAIRIVKPTHIFNLAAQSHVGASFDYPISTFDINAKGVLRILEAIRDTDIRLYQASTSEMYGGGTSLDEKSPFAPHSPYAVAKLAAHQACGVYRQAYDVKVSCGILFNHESPLRGEQFVTQKICKHVASGVPTTLGNLAARRDWGHAMDYVRAMHMMLEVEPDDFVIATGKSHSVKDWIRAAEKVAGRKLLYQVAEREMRPWDVQELEGNPRKAMEMLGWKPKYSFEQLVEEMTEFWLKNHAYFSIRASEQAKAASLH